MGAIRPSIPLWSTGRHIMTTERRPDLDPTAVAEARVIKHAFRDAGIHVRTQPDPDGGIAFMYEKGVLLVPDEELDRVLAIVAPPGGEVLPPVYPEGPFPPERPAPETGEEGSGEGGPGEGDSGEPPREPAGGAGEPPPGPAEAAGAPSAWRPQLRRVTRGLVALALLG